MREFRLSRDLRTYRSLCRGDVAPLRGALDGAATHYPQALTTHQAIGHRLGPATAHDGLGDVVLLRGDLNGARPISREESRALDSVTLVVTAVVAGGKAPARSRQARSRTLTRH